MLTLRFLAVRDVPRPSATDASLPRKATWSIRTQGGNSTRFVDLDEGAQHHQHDNEGEERSASAADNSERGTVANSTDARPVWPEQVEVEDREGQDTIQVAVVLDLAPTATKPREKCCHSITTIDVLDVRLRPGEKVTLWRPLQPLGASTQDSIDNDGDHGSGEIQIAVTYNTDDCVDQGYMYALFCGLVPLPFILSWSSSNAKSSLLPADKFLKHSRYNKENSTVHKNSNINSNKAITTSRIARSSSSNNNNGNSSDDINEKDRDSGNTRDSEKLTAKEQKLQRATTAHPRAVDVEMPWSRRYD
ncbi:unnamed protein product [Ectocarpus sp. 8 AP-2014]